MADKCREREKMRQHLAQVVGIPRRTAEYTHCWELGAEFIAEDLGERTGANMPPVQTPPMLCLGSSEQQPALRGNPSPSQVLLSARDIYDGI